MKMQRRRRRKKRTKMEEKPIDMILIEWHTIGKQLKCFKCLGKIYDCYCMIEFKWKTKERRKKKHNLFVILDPNKKRL